MATHNGTAPAPRAPQFARRQDISVPFMSSPSFQDNPPKIDEFPRGYPSLSAFLSGDREFTMFRSFTRLHARVLLHKQDELAELEQRLDQLDQKDSKVDSYRLLTNRHSSGDTERRALLSEIEGKLNDFKRPEPEESQIKSVRNWVDGKRPVVYSETTFLNDWSDLKRARHTVEKGGLENLLASYSSWPSLRGIYEFFSLLDTSARSDDPKVKLIKASRLVAVSRALTTVLAVTTLVVPIGVLYSVHPVPMRLCIIAAFTCIFSSALCWLTSSRNYEIFSATAAYCAVMVVFVGSLP
ncbi:uncharacterized protein LW94_13349 [Fusarium fujikuroi]|nr:uncharacterized protein Y057_11387 [Fusarium fujikuroi]KLP15693.1 uncharacterized protein LW94_13349 [Fusarium fujikuroi]